MRKILFSFFCLLCLIPWLILSRASISTALFYLISIFLLALSFGSFFYVTHFFEKSFKEHLKNKFKKEIGHVDLEDYKNQTRSLLKKVKELMQELSAKDASEKTLLQKINQLKEIHQNQEDEYQFLHQDLQSQLEKRERSLTDYQQTIKEQRQIIEKKQQDINVLNLQINDLKYELENLIHVAQKEPEIFQEQKKEEGLSKKDLLPTSLTEKLQRYIDLSQKVTGKNPFAQLSQKSFPFGTLVIDQRRLFDYFQNDDSEVILVYSSEENRLIFINDQVKSLLGWSPSQFLNDFSFLVQKGLNHWQQALLASSEETQEVRLLIKTQSGQDILTHCYLKKVPQGVFAGHVLGILSSAAKR